MSVIGQFRLKLGAAVAKSSPAVGQVLGPLGINMMNFCKDFNERTGKVRDNVPVQVTLFPKTNRTFKYLVRTPQTQWFLKRIARMPLGPPKNVKHISGMTMKEVFHLAQQKSQDPQFIGVPLLQIVNAVIGTCDSNGVKVTQELLPKYRKRDDTVLWDMEGARRQEKEIRKAVKKALKKKK